MVGGEQVDIGGLPLFLARTIFSDERALWSALTIYLSTLHVRVAEKSNDCCFPDISACSLQPGAWRCVVFLNVCLYMHTILLKTKERTVIEVRC